MSRARDIADLAGSADAGGLTGRNLIINGAMTVAQRGTSSTSSGYQTVDRFRNDYSGASVTQSQQVLSSGDPYDAGFRYFYRHENTATSSATSAQLQVFQFVEAQNIAGSGWNYISTSSSVTVSFWVRSSLAGTYVFNMQSVDGTAQNYSTQFTLSANTWTKVTKTIPGNANLQFDNNSERGMWVNFMVHLGTDYTDSGFTHDSWAAYSGSSRAGDFGQNWCNTASATFDITGVQLELGETATPFEHENYGTTLAKCQRYFEKMGGESSYAPIGQGSQRTTTETYFHVYFKQTKRAAPTVGFINNVIVTDRLAFDQVVSNIGANHPSVFGFHGHFNHSSVGSGNRPLFVCSGPTAPFGYMTFDSEL